MPPSGTSSTYCQNPWCVATRMQSKGGGSVERGNLCHIEQPDAVVLPTRRTDKRKRVREAIAMCAILQNTKIIVLSKSGWLNWMDLKTVQLSCSHLTPSVCLVDCSCLHLTSICESRDQSFRTTDNDVSVHVGLLSCKKRGQYFFAQESRLINCRSCHREGSAKKKNTSWSIEIFQLHSHLI